MAYIGREPQIGNFQVCDAISVVNGQAAYTMQVNSVNVSPETANHVLCSLNGVLQKSGSSFTVSGATITFASNLVTNDVIDFIQILGSTLDLGTPSDDTVATASLKANSVTAAKFNADVISGQTELATAPADTDEFLVSDAGVLKRLDYSLIKAAPAIELLATTTVSSATSAVSFDGYFSSTYKDYKLTYSHLMPTSDNYILYMRVRQSNSDRTDSSGYRSLTIGVQGEFTGDDDQSNGDSHIAHQQSYGRVSVSSTEGNIESTDVYGGATGHLEIINPLQTSHNKIIFTSCIYTGANDNNGNFSFLNYGAVRYKANTSALSGVTLYMSSGNIDSGIFKLYGIK